LIRSWKSLRGEKLGRFPAVLARVQFIIAEAIQSVSPVAAASQKYSSFFPFVGNVGPEVITGGLHRSGSAPYRNTLVIDKDPSALLNLKHQGQLDPPCRHRSAQAEGAAFGDSRRCEQLTHPWLKCSRGVTGLPFTHLFAL